jgi:hypothetical protein
MATKPTVIPSWATSGTIVDPGSSKKALGWVVEDPPYEYFNYLHNAAGQWIEYLNTILTGTSHNLTIRAEEGTAGITAVRGGSSPAGTNQTGGSLWLQAGTSTGSAGSSVIIYASTAGSSGSGVNTNEIYARANGSTGTFQILKGTHISGVTVVGTSGTPVSGSTFSVNTTGIANSLVVRTADGNIGINSNGATTAKMILSGTVPGGTSSLGLLNSTVHTENTTGNLTGFSSNISRTGAGTLSNVFHFLSNPGSFSVTPTNHHGFHAAAATGGVGTNNYGFFGALASGSGNWNFFGAGSAPNHFNGATVIGASSTIPSGSAFSVNSTGVSNSLVVRSAEGNIGINSNGNTDNKVLVAGSLNTGSTSTSVRSDVSFGSSVTANAVGFRSQIARSSGGTLTNLVGFQAFNGTLDITPTNNVGFQVGALSTGTNIYGFHGQIAAATGRYNLYMSGTAQNFLAGATTINSTLTVTGTSTLGAVNAAAISGTTGTFSGTLGVTGTTTLAAVNATNGTFSGTLGVTGTTTLAAVNATNGAFSGTLTVTGTSTLGVTNTGALSSTTIAASSTLNVTGTSTLAAVNATNGTFSGTLGVTGTSTLGTTNTGALTSSVSVAAPYANLENATDSIGGNGRVWSRGGFPRIQANSLRHNIPAAFQHYSTSGFVGAGSTETFGIYTFPAGMWRDGAAVRVTGFAREIGGSSIGNLSFSLRFGPSGGLRGVTYAGYDVIAGGGGIVVDITYHIPGVSSSATVHNTGYVAKRNAAGIFEHGTDTAQNLTAATTLQLVVTTTSDLAVNTERLFTLQIMN